MFGLFKKGIEHYERELASPSAKKRKNAARSLGNVKEPGAGGLLLDALQDVDSEVREAAAYALGKLEVSTAVGALERGLEDEDNRVRRAAGASLIQLGESIGLEPLLRALNDSSEDNPGESVALAILETDDGIELLARSLREHPDSEVRRLAAVVLSCAAPDDAIATAALARAYEEDSAEDVRKTAKDALGLI